MVLCFLELTWIESPQRYATFRQCIVPVAPGRAGDVCRARLLPEPSGKGSCPAGCERRICRIQERRHRTGSPSPATRLPPRAGEKLYSNSTTRSRPRPRCCRAPRRPATGALRISASASIRRLRRAPSVKHRPVQAQSGLRRSGRSYVPTAASAALGKEGLSGRVGS